MRGLLLAILALLLITGDSGRHQFQLLKNAHSAHNVSTNAIEQGPHVLLWLAAKQGDMTAQHQLVTLATASESQYWLEKLVSIDNADAAWALYQLLGEDAGSQRFVQLAARGNVAQAQLTFAMSTTDPAQREKWLLRAAEQAYTPAQAALADWYLLQGQSDLAKPWLAKTAKADTQSAFKYGRLLWQDNERSAGEKFLQQAANAGHTEAANMVSIINRYSPKAPIDVDAYQWAADKVCHQRIQIFGTSLSTMARADALFNEFSQDERLYALPLCIAPPVWLKPNLLSCDEDLNGRGQLACNVKPLAPVVEKRYLTHAVIIAEHGKANVQNGVMYLDISDAYSVFVHELAHFSGFIDEYPLSRALAKRYCNTLAMKRFLPPNVVIDGEITYSPLVTLEQWWEIGQEVTDEVGISLTKTCDAVGVGAYKPSAAITFMEHHDSGVIPPLYIALWRKQLQTPATQRPISMNLFQAYHYSGQPVQAGRWLSVYENSAH